MVNQPVHPQGGAIPQLQIPEGLESQYVNFVRITHSPSELILDFAQLMPGESPPRVRSRIVMSPLSAKLFFRALGENLAKFEAAFGEIRIPGDASLAEYLFKPPAPPKKE